MDESWEALKNPSIPANDKSTPQPSLGEPELEPLPIMSLKKLASHRGFVDQVDLGKGITNIGFPEVDTPIDDTRFKNIRSFHPLEEVRNSALIDVEDSGKVNISENLFRLPPKVTPGLTQLLTGKEKATLVHDNVSKPIINTDPKSKIIATYRILVPIYIPAYKLPNKLSIAPPKSIKYVKEVHTEMVPVKKAVSRVNNIIKAERVPQQIITDYVKADGTSVPSSVDDKLKPNEKVLKSVVTNFD